MSAQTHEHFIHAVRRIAAARLDGCNAGQETSNLLATKMVYGLAVNQSYYGACYRDSWSRGESTGAVIEISATQGVAPLDLAKVVIHECAHQVAGHAAGHGAAWKAECARLGLLDARATVGPKGEIGELAETLVAEVATLGDPRETDGAWKSASGFLPPILPPMGPRGGKGAPTCPSGRGSRGGKSRGPGSGSRLRLYLCGMSDPGCRRVRVSADDWRATCGACGEAFKQETK